MESALIVSRTEKGVAYFTEILSADSCGEIVALQSCGEARRLLLERDFDLVVINAPLQDESGESLSRHIASREASQVILVVKSEHFDEVSAATENEGILVVAKPINSTIFWATLKLAKSAQSRLRRMQTENSKLKQKIDDIRIIDRAKCSLISHLKINEQEAHRFIEKHAMDMRTTRRAVAEELLKTYEN
jgi:Response regulator with putative antiterminator output domain